MFGISSLISRIPVLILIKETWRTYAETCSCSRRFRKHHLCDVKMCWRWRPKKDWLYLIKVANLRYLKECMICCSTSILKHVSRSLLNVCARTLDLCHCHILRPATFLSKWMNVMMFRATFWEIRDSKTSSRSLHQKITKWPEIQNV